MYGGFLVLIKYKVELTKSSLSESCPYNTGLSSSTNPYKRLVIRTMITERLKHLEKYYINLNAKPAEK